jgi:hypothetical protein
MSTTIDDVHKIFRSRDYKAFKWVFCKYICESASDTFTDYELFSESGLRAYMGDEGAMKAFILEDQENIYKIFAREVLESLVHRRFLRPVMFTEADGQEVPKYEKTQELRKKCPQFMQYLMGDIDTVR